MKTLFLTRATSLPVRISSLYKLSVLLIALTALGSFSSCQRAPYAYFTPTPRVPHQRIAVTNSTVNPPVEPQITASLKEEVPVSTKPIWEQPADNTFSHPDVTAVDQTPSQGQRKQPHRNKTVPPQCDQIVLRSGDVIEARIKEIGVNEIKYKKCDRPDGPDYTISKRDVLSIKYTNGDVERFSTNANSYNTSSSGGSRASYDSPTNSQNDGPKTDPFAIVAIATGGLAILTGYGAFLLGAAAIVFGALSLTRIRKEPARFKGKGLALGGMIAGIVAAGVILLYMLL
ncbi:DUF4190 domain-containing protein [Spirosoma endbachense]|uniref:DUF4190 domain-containing protein n=1 Tax=Spirosoma endbachense TaxID=2666025 RepID=A0A6P1W5N1_9BACT|nr:DUF4190 domain-containing protein [Spirosoma endbachense]QHV99026.1 hypothetical protein GJR95_30245 [Spirosoma endbachense]